MSRRAGLLAAVLIVALVASSVTWCLTWYRSHQIRAPLLTMAMGVLPERTLVGAAQNSWLVAGSVPGASTGQADMVRLALLDLRTLVLPNCASLAGWPQPWHYVWPRDASFVAVALAETGHPDDAACVLRFLQRVQPASGVFEARYLPDGSGVPDGRGLQSDSVGWVLWAVAQVSASLPDRLARQNFLTSLRPLVTRSVDAARTLTDTPSRLPALSMDYWEVRDPRLSLGTAAPIAAGLLVAPRLLRALGEGSAAEATAIRADEVSGAIRSTFGAQGYPRYLGDDAPDTSLTFLLPPFAPVSDPAVETAWRRALATMRRPAGGLAPGAGWKRDGISWTPETALAGLAAAHTGELDAARSRLAWIAAHRTDRGAIPEKVLSNGAAAGPAPLAWADALVVLTAVELDRRAPASEPGTVRGSVPGTVPGSVRRLAAGNNTPSAARSLPGSSRRRSRSERAGTAGIRDRRRRGTEA